MNLKEGLAVTAILLAGCASSGGDMVAANKPGKSVPDTATVWSQGTGLLIMGVRAFEMNNADKVSKQPTVLNGISVKNLGTSKVYNISLNEGV